MVVGTKPGLAAVGSATVAVISQSSGIAAIFAMRRVTWYRSAIIAGCTIIAPFTCCCTNSAVASTAVVRESSKREVCVLGTPSSSSDSFPARLAQKLRQLRGRFQREDIERSPEQVCHTLTNRHRHHIVCKLEKAAFPLTLMYSVFWSIST